MEDPIAPSPLLVTIAPVSSSFFAGEEFACVLTFTNTRQPLPSTLPLASSSTFASSPHSATPAPSIGSDARRVLSSAAALGGAPRRHGKSMSVDVRTFARQLNLESADEGARDEGYYRQQARQSISDAAAFTPEAAALDDAALPRPKGLIGRTPLAQRVETPTTASTFAKHQRQAMSLHIPPSSTAAAASTTLERSSLGMGLPSAPTHIDLPSTPRAQLSLITPSSSSNSGLSTLATRIASTASRTPSGPIASHHPHGRKRSVAAIQAEDLSSAFALDATPSPPIHAHTQAGVPPSPATSDAPPLTPRTGGAFYSAGAGANDTLESVLRDDISAWSRPSGNFGLPSTPSTASSSRRGSVSSVSVAAVAALPEGSVSLLWSFAQFGGEFKLDESLVKPGEFEELKRRLASDQSVLGGGELGLNASAAGAGAEKGKAGWGSYLSGALFSRSQSGASGARRGHGRSASTMGERQVRTLEARAVPLFSTPPSIIAVDLNLAPGESKSYTFRIPLPPDLPPSYVGRAISFTYTLTLGTNRIDRSRASSSSRHSSSSSAASGQKSRLIRIPFRVYNHVSVTGAPAFFDLGNPVVKTRDEAVVKEEKELSAEWTTGGLKRRNSGKGKREGERGASGAKESAVARSDFESYARQLLSSCADESALDSDSEVPTDLEIAATAAASARDLLVPPPQDSPPRARTGSFTMPRSSSPFGRRASTASETLGVEEDDAPKTSMEAVEVLSRNSQKVSYDISKDGQIAAVLTLVKSKYRLGDTVAGVVTMNKAGAIARVVRIAATLETHEVVQPSLATLPPARIQRATRCVHAECHESTLDAGQVSFSLPIPSGATPDFVTSGVKLVWTVRLSFLTLAAVRPQDGSVRLPPPPHLTPLPSDGYEHFHTSLTALPALSGPAPHGAPAGLEATKLEVVECAVPLNVLPHSTRFRPGEASVYA